MAFGRILGACALSVAFGSASMASGPGGQDLGLLDYDVQALDVPEQAGEAFEVAVTVEGDPLTLILSPYSVRSINFQAYTDDGTGKVPYDAPPPATYRGFAPEMPGSDVRASVINGQLYGAIKLDGRPVVYVEPLTRVIPEADVDLHMVYTAADVDWSDVSCGVENAGPQPGQAAGMLFGPSPAEIKVAELGLDADWQFFDILAGNDEDTAIILIESVINVVDGIYEDDVEIIYEITGIVIRTSPNDPYSGSIAENLLNQVRVEWLTNQQDIPHDLAEMFSGVNFNGGTIGIAWVGSVCTATRYSTIQAIGLSFGARVGVSAHETGHNFDANHCDGFNPCYIMCSGLGGCSGNISMFAPVSINAILGFKAVAFCLGDEVDPPDPPLQLDLPFFEGGEDFTLDVAEWYLVEGAEITGLGVDEPEGFLSVLFTGSDTITTQQLKTLDLLNPFTNFYVNFWSQQRHIEVGESMTIEYFSQSEQEWLVLDTIVSTGDTQDEFQFHEYEMPLNAYGDEFQIRFTVDNDADQDDAWYLDAIGVSIEPAGGCPADFNGDGEINILDFVAFQAAFSDGDDAADCDENGQLNVLDFICFQNLFAEGCP